VESVAQVSFVLGWQWIWVKVCKWPDLCVSSFILPTLTKPSVQWNEMTATFSSANARYVRKGGENLCQIPPPITMHQGCNPWCTKGAIRNAPNPQNTQKWLFLAGLHLPCSPWCTSQEKLDIPHLTCLAAALFQSVIRDAW
jgi:hypothetical protein